MSGFGGYGSQRDVVMGDDGIPLPLDELSQTLGYDGSSNLTSITVVYNGSTYVQTLTYTGNNLTAVSGWVKQ